VDEIRPGYRFDVSCDGSVPEAIICALEASSWEDAVRLAVSLGGDADTQAAIAGGIAGARFDIGARVVAEVRVRLGEVLGEVLGRCWER
jgi:ADP-ribosylglycohydrolase